MLRGLLWLSVAVLVAFAPGTAAKAQSAASSTAPANMVEVQVHRRTVNVPVAEGTDIRFRRLSTGAGLSQTRVEQIAQDDQGFMWFGTQFGLNRYDGYDFKVFAPNPKNADTISCGNISAVFKDRSNMLWVGCGRFLERFDPTTERFSHYRLKSSDSDSVPAHVHNIIQDRSGTLWLGTGSGLYGVDSTTGRIIHHYTHDPRDTSSLNQNNVKPVTVDGSGRLLVADGNDLEQLDQNTGKVTWRLPLPGMADIFSSDPAGSARMPAVSHPRTLLWIDYTKNSKDGEFALLNPDAGELTYYSFYDQNSGKTLQLSVSGMLEDGSGSLWLGASVGLIKFEPEAGRAIRYHHHPDDPESLDDDRVIAMEQDRQGNIWVGLHAREPNVFATRKPSFTTILRERLVRNPQGEYMVSAIYEDRDTLWVGASGDLIRTDRKTGKSTSYPLNDDVISITGDSAGVIWVGTGYKGLYRLDPRTSHFTNFPLNPSSSYSYQNGIIRIFIDRPGTMWLATRRGLQRFDAATGRFTEYKRSQTDEYYDIAEDPNGRLWLGGNGGLQCYDPATGQFTVYEHQVDNPGSLSDNTVSSVLVDHSGDIWAATYNGLARLDQKSATFTNYYANDGLPSSRVSCVLEEGHDALWLSTNRGVSRFDLLARTFANYSIADGLPGMDLTGWVTCSKSTSGEMFFGGFSGATAFFPDKVVDSDYVPPVVFTDFLLSGHSVNIGGSAPLKRSINYTSRIALTHEQNNISLQFAALNFASPSTVRYRYRLDSLDSEWHDSSAGQRFVTYPKLAPGKYTFRVEASTGHGVWNLPGATLHIDIDPPWWNTWLFRLATVVAFGFGALFLYRLRIHEITRRLNLLFDERTAERTRIARDLHDTMLQSFQASLIQMQRARNHFSRSTEEAIRTLDNAIGTAEQAIVEGRDAIQDLRPTVDPQPDLEHLLTVAGQELAKAQDANETPPTFRVTVEGPHRSLSPILQDEVYRIGREVLRNAFRHAQAGHIEAEIRYDNRKLRLRIRDDGKGIDRNIMTEGARAGHWGLPGARERATRIGARLDFWSEAGAGTEVELTVPASSAYAKPQAQRRFGFFRKNDVL